MEIGVAALNRSTMVTAVGLISIRWTMAGTNHFTPTARFYVLDVRPQMRREFCKPARQEPQLLLAIDMVGGGAEPAPRALQSEPKFGV